MHIFGKGKWNEDLITEQSTLASERYIYDGEKQQVLVVTDNTVYESIAITYKDDVQMRRVCSKSGSNYYKH